MSPRARKQAFLPLQWTLTDLVVTLALGTALSICLGPLEYICPALEYISWSELWTWVSFRVNCKLLMDSKCGLSGIKKSMAVSEMST